MAVEAMLKRIRMYFRSTFVRYMLSYVLIMMLLMGCVMGYAYFYCRKTIYQTTETGEINRLASARYQSERLAGTLENLAARLSVSAQAGDETALSKALATAGETGEWFDRAFVYLRGAAELDSADGRLPVRALGYENLDAETLEALLQTDDAQVIACQPVSVNGAEPARYLTYLFPLGAEDAKPVGCALFLLSEERFRPLLEDEVGGGCNRYVLKDGETVLAGETFSLSERYLPSALREAEETETYVRRIAGRDYLFIAMPGSRLGLSYYSVMSLNGIYAAAATGWVSFAAILLIFFVPSLIFMIVISRRNYRPIREMGAQFAAGAQDDDLRAIQAGIHDLLGRNRDLDSQLARSLPARRALFVQNLVRGRYASAEEARAAARTADVDIDHACFAVMLLGEPRGASVDPAKLIALAPAGVFPAAAELIAHEQMLLVVFADNSGPIHDYAVALTRSETVRASRVPVAVSDVHADVSEMPTAYLEATSAYESRFVMGDSRLLSFRDISLPARSVPPQARAYVDDVKRALEGGDAGEINGKLDELVTYLRTADMSLYAFRQIYNEVIVDVMSLCGLPDGSDSLKYYDLFSLSDCRSIDELDTILRRVCAGAIRENPREEARPLIHDLMNDMLANYADPAFTMAGLADRFNISTTRLTVEFKEHLNMTPSDYLTSLRMEHTKRLLRQTDRPIKDICAEVGYGDVSSFIRRFKQYAGATPAQYRQGAQGGDAET